MVQVKDIAWAAGFLEGEGCFYHPHNNTGGVAITAPQVETEPLYRLQKLFGGSVLEMKLNNGRLGKKPLFRWNLYGGKAAGVMMTIYSFMSPRRKEKIASLLTDWRTSRGKQRVW